MDLDDCGDEEGHVMTNSWTEPARELASEARGWAGVWTLTYATGVALQRLAAMEGWDEDLTFTYAGLDVALATSELAWADPSEPAHAGPVDLGLLAATERRAAIGVVLQLLGCDIERLSTLVTDPTTSGSRVLSGIRALGLLIGAERSLRAGWS